MKKMYFKAIICAAAVASLTACGGGGDSICGEKTQAFGVEFETKSFALATGTSATLASKVTPESCRSDMTFGIKSGVLPTGMTLNNGNVTGAPSVPGTFKFQIYIIGVKGYQPYADFIAPRSSQVTVTVAP
jgi:hypothetical protein